MFKIASLNGIISTDPRRIIGFLMTFSGKVQYGLVERESPNEAARDPGCPCDADVS